MQVCAWGDDRALDGVWRLSPRTLDLRGGFESSELESFHQEKHLIHIGLVHARNRNQTADLVQNGLFVTDGVEDSKLLGTQTQIDSGQAPVAETPKNQLFSMDEVVLEFIQCQTSLHPLSDERVRCGFEGYDLGACTLAAVKRVFAARPAENLQEFGADLP